MKFKTKKWIQMQKNYFAYGKSIFGFIYGLIALFGISSQNVKLTLIIGIIYYIFSYFFGKWLYKHKWVDADNECNNIYNPFVKQMRRKIGIPNK
jgi:hypothetical protein